MASGTGVPQNQIDPNNVPSGPVFVPRRDAGTAIVLSGGGAKGDFEVGAVRCLYDHGITPKILCGTSVGSINALKLAEGETGADLGAPQNHVRGLKGLEKIWLSLNTDKDMWSLEAGAAQLFAAIPNIQADINTVEAQLPGLVSAGIGGAIASFLGAPFILAFAPALADAGGLSAPVSDLIANAMTVIKDAGNIQGLANYDPLEALMRQGVNYFPPHQQASGIALRLAMVALEDGALRYVTEHNQMIERDQKITKVMTPATPAQIAALKAQAAALQAQIDDLMAENDPLPNEVKHPNKPKNGQMIAKLKTQLAAIKAAIVRNSVPFDLIRAAIASSSLPVICRPTVMQDGKTYIDGGIRTLAPIQVAIDMGSTNVYAIAAGTRKFDAKSIDQITGGTPLPLLGIALRVGEEILPDEVGRRDLFPDNPWPVPVTVIQPDPSLDDIHDGLTIEPGLVRIRMAYGFMRAYDTLRAAEKFIPSFQAFAAQENSVKGKTLAIVNLRKQIWDAEFPANGKQIDFPASMLPPAPYTVTDVAVDPAKHALVKTLKGQLKALIDARIAYYADPKAKIDGAKSLPADFATWSTAWEKHGWTPTQAL